MNQFEVNEVIASAENRANPIPKELNRSCTLHFKTYEAVSIICEICCVLKKRYLFSLDKYVEDGVV
jgi:hypothetical protein